MEAAQDRSSRHFRREVYIQQWTSTSDDDDDYLMEQLPLLEDIFISSK